MLEARMPQGAILRKCIDAIKDLVTDGNFDCNDSGIALQAMDNSHVALVNLFLRASGFDPYRCDRNLTLGVNLGGFSKVLKCMGNDDVVTVKAEDDGDTVSLTFESKDGGRVSEFELKLVDIDSEHLGIPDTNYDAIVSMPASEFQRICRDLSVLGESVIIDVSKDGVKFSASGESGTGSITVKQGASVDKESEGTTINLNSAVQLTFSLKYLQNFSKATALADQVTLSLSADVPLLVEYTIGEVGYVRYYLAPKIGDEN
ncbi:proliferating cell nuclear antigen [Gonapodya prolifera JEL478]|uniref:DNA sliding clamp PCNA n=1 Tax=Gonapodya prolifera (strain JEL478) TaxID=1344416 RepID=A0A139AQ08_GONPJ|nr:proliferating cell nuclear antigen [Gonapodya prolifera JEL478]|eukprot:KXS18575.1 proliferating cell nuclear antigen [Gonapodya prolifera JEL478]